MKLKDRASSFSLSWKAPAGSVPHTNKGTNRRVCTHRYADCLLKTGPSNIANMWSIKNSSMLMISVSENFLVESEWFFFLQNKICPFLAQGICIYVGHSFSWNTVGPTPHSVLQLRVRNSCVDGRKVKCFNAIAEVFVNIIWLGLGLLVFNRTVNNISTMSWRSV